EGAGKGSPHIGLECLFRTGCPKHLLVEDLARVLLPLPFARAEFAARQKRYAQQNDGTKKVRAKKRGVLRNPGAPVMTRDHHWVAAERVYQSHQVARQLEDIVGFDLVRTVGLAVAAHVGCDGAEASVRKRV